ncbi:MAG TPA: hypothetical protein VGP88_09080, partial [Thermoplasmata archaeon]|nr:hypothetical protein [Thermoplasmata archaeon]
SGAGFLNVSVPTRGTATVLVDGRPFPFAHGWANLTLPVGNHSLDLQNFTNATAVFAILPGATTDLNLSGAGELTINETGLPAGTTWGVTANGTALTTSAEALSLNLPNGTYPVTYAAVPGYDLVGSAPANVTLPGTSRIPLVFTAFTYEVTVVESGLPASTPWWVNASGLLVPSTESSLQVPAPNGSTPYVVGSLYEFLADPPAGTILVSSGVASPVSVTFSYRPTFLVGAVVPADANVTIGGVAQVLANGHFNDSVTPGSYEVVASAAGYATQQVTVGATPGNVTWANLTLVANPTPYSPAPSAGGGISVLTASLLVVGVAAIAVVAVAVLVRRRR